MDDADDAGQARGRQQPGVDGGLKAFHGLIAELEGMLPMLKEDDRREIEPYLKALLRCVRRLAPAALRCAARSTANRADDETVRRARSGVPPTMSCIAACGALTHRRGAPLTGQAGTLATLTAPRP